MDNSLVKFFVVGAVALVIFSFFSLGVFTIIGPGERGVVLRLGAVEDRIMPEGFNWKMPFIEDVEKVDVKTQKEQVDAGASTKDLQNVTTTIALNYHPQADKVNKMWQNIGKDYKIRVIDPAIQEAVKAATAEFTAEELVTKRAEVKDKAILLLKERLLKHYIDLDDLSIVNFHFSESFNQSIEQKVRAEQDALTAKNRLEQVKFEAEQRVQQARGEAEAIRIQAQAIQAQGGKEYVNLKAIEKWNGTLPQYMMGEATPFISLK